MHRSVRFLRIAAAVGLALAAPPMPVSAQLRPLDPVDWRVFEPGVAASAQLGGAVLAGQRASIGGIEGRLVEAPAAILTWTTGRVALRAIVHPLRIFEVDSAYGAPLPGTTHLDPGREVDAGDNAVETVVRLTPDAAPAIAALRWGVRLSTHNDRKGLDRHKTDFYALAGGSLPHAGWTVEGEAGLGIFGTREAGVEKAMPLLYAAAVRRRFGGLEPLLAVAGQAARRQVRGNEDLAELRAGVRAGRTTWVEASLLRGLATYSPSWGVQLYAGVRLP